MREQGQCPVCRQVVGTRQDGGVKEHKVTVEGSLRACPGIGRQALPANEKETR